MARTVPASKLRIPQYFGRRPDVEWLPAVSPEAAAEQHNAALALLDRLAADRLALRDVAAARQESLDHLRRKLYGQAPASLQDVASWRILAASGLGGITSEETHNEARSAAPVNVASVPQRSPFRYPGGKSWLIPQVRVWLTQLPKKPAVLVEPFAGGGSISLLAAAENLADHVVMVELDPDVAVVWRVILSDDRGDLCTRIVEFDCTLENVQAALVGEPAGDLDWAFRTILRNRVNRGGILSAGAGMIKAGEAGKGIRSRWYPETLAKRIRAIGAYSDRITFVEGDAFEAIDARATDPACAFFVDPPYTAGGKKAGSRLYTHNALDHERLFRTARDVAGPVLMTYDNAEEVKQLADAHGLCYRPIAMKSTHHTEMRELLISKDVSWVR